MQIQIYWYKVKCSTEITIHQLKNGVTVFRKAIITSKTVSNIAVDPNKVYIPFRAQTCLRRLDCWKID